MQHSFPQILFFFLFLTVVNGFRKILTFVFLFFFAFVLVFTRFVCCLFFLWVVCLCGRRGGGKVVFYSMMLNGVFFINLISCMLQNMSTFLYTSENVCNIK